MPPELTSTSAICILVFSFIQDLGKLAAAYALFRFPFKEYRTKLALLALLECLNDFLIIDVLKFPFIISILLSLLLLTAAQIVLLKMPVLYSFILAVSSQILLRITQFIWADAFTRFSIYTPSEIYSRLVPLCITMLLGGLSCFLVAYGLYRRKIGFVFISNKITLGERSSFGMVAAIISAAGAMEFMINYFIAQNSSPQDLVLACVIAGLLSFLAIHSKVKQDWGFYRERKNEKNLKS